MKLITAIIEQTSVESLASALPTASVESLTISEAQQYRGGSVAVEVYRGVRLPKYFARLFRAELLVDDAHVEKVVDSISSASDSGVLGATKLWIIDAEQVVSIRNRTPAAV